MNIRFKSVDIESFRSIKRAIVDFENQGTVIVKGINEYEEKATSNGSGKSSIFEAIVFALFDETSSGEKDVANRFLNNGYTITLKMEIDGVEYTIERQNKNNKSIVVLYKNGIDISARNKSDTNKLIISILGISKSIFLDSVFLSQGANTNLASLSPTARKERLEILTNTDATVNDFKETLKEIQNEYEAKCVECQLQINKLTGNIETTNYQKMELNNKIAQIDAEIRRLQELGTIEQIEQSLNDLTNESTRIDGEITDILKNISELDTKTTEIIHSSQADLDEKTKLETKRVEMQDEWSRLNASTEKIKMDIYYQNQTKSRLQSEIENIKNSDKCPTCGRKYENANEQHILELIAEKNKAYDDCDSNIANCNAQLEELQISISSIETDGQQINQQISVINDRVNNINIKVEGVEIEKRALMTKQQNLMMEKNNIQSSIQDLQNKKAQILKTTISNKDEFIEMLANCDKQIQEYESQITQEQEKLQLNNDYVGVIKNSIQMVTKEFRTYLLQNSIQYLNNLLASYSKNLFSNDQDVISIQGDDSKLNITLGNATYESLSGGEKTRVNIALLLAQKSLASSIGNISCNIIILDEILGYCDSHAESNVIDLITKELESLESIYMVSHKEIPIGYDSELIIVKDKQGLSSIRNF